MQKRKNGQKMQNQNLPEKGQPRPTKVAYDSKTKRYMYYDNKVVTAGEPIRLEIPDSFLYFCYTQ